MCLLCHLRSQAGRLHVVQTLLEAQALLLRAAALINILRPRDGRPGGREQAEYEGGVQSHLGLLDVHVLLYCLKAVVTVTTLIGSIWSPRNVANYSGTKVLLFD